MKKLVRWVCLLLLPLFFFIVIIGTIGANEKKQGSESGGICGYSNSITHNEKIENKRNYVKKRVASVELTNVVLGIYAFEDYKSIDNILNTVNSHYVHVTEKEVELTEGVYIQSYQWGIEYLNYLIEKKESISIKINQEYSKDLLQEQKDKYMYYMSVLPLINEKCSINVDGLPLKKPYQITGYYPNYGGDGSGGRHYGVDFGVPIGTDLYAVGDATVAASNNGCAFNDGYLGNVCGIDNGFMGSGNFVLLKINNEGIDYYVMYCHMKDVNVSTNETVFKGQKIGTSGNSGNSSGAHLHLEIRKGNKNMGSEDGVINPCEFVKGLCD